MSLRELYKGTKIIETIENYSFSEKLSQIQENKKTKNSYYFFKDEDFWREVSAFPLKYWGQKVDLLGFVASNWVARIPGLFWSKSSELIREHTFKDIAKQSKRWIEFNPPGKSKKVMGGIGTLLLPPTDDGKVLLSVSAGCNASSGIPILCYPEVIDQLDIKQGDCINIIGAKWQPMDTHWASKFASTKDIPRGYLVIDNINKIQKCVGNFPIAYHPFSLMEYEYKDSLFYDFVYMTADSNTKNVEKKIEFFFSDYAIKEGRNGEYLLNPNIVSPIFEARYSSPSELTHASEKAKLKLLYERIRGVHFNQESLEQLMIQLPKLYQTSTSIIRLARSIGLNVALLVEDSAASMSAQLISKCIEREMFEDLIDRIAIEYPNTFN